jgi:hypothetical protein
VPVGGSRWLMDGGVLDNSPFAPLLNELDVARSERNMDRVVVFVVPYAEAHGRDGDERPTFGQVLASARGLPGQVTTMNDFERLERYLSALKGRFLATRRLLRVAGEAAATAGVQAAEGEVLRGRSQTGLESSATHLLPAYRRWRLESTFRMYGLPVDLLDDPRIAALPTDRWLPTSVADPSFQADGAWCWGLTPARRIAAYALSAIHEVRSMGRPSLSPSLHRELRDWEKQVQDNINRLVKLELRLGGARERRFFGFSPTSPGDESVVTAATDLLKALNDRWSDCQDGKSAQQEALDAALACAQALSEARGGLASDTAACAVLGLPSELAAAEILHLLLLAGVVLGAADIATPARSEERTAAFRLQRVDASPWSGGGCMLENPVEFVSADLASPRKLLGMSARHFGGFLRAAWRANDWMWGRLDAIGRIVDIVINEDRVRLLQDDGVDNRLARDLAGVVMEDLHWDFATASSLQLALRNQVAFVIAGDDKQHEVCDTTATEQLEAVFGDEIRAATGRTRRVADQEPLESIRRALTWRLQVEVIGTTLSTVARAEQSDRDADLGGRDETNESVQKQTTREAVRRFAGYKQPFLGGAMQIARRPKVLAPMAQIAAGLWTVGWRAVWKRFWRHPFTFVGLLVTLPVWLVHWMAAFAFTSLRKRSPWEKVGLPVGGSLLPALLGLGLGLVSWDPAGGGRPWTEYVVASLLVVVVLLLFDTVTGGLKAFCLLLLLAMLAVTLVLLFVDVIPVVGWLRMLLLIGVYPVALLGVVIVGESVTSIQKSAWVIAAVAGGAVGGFFIRAVHGDPSASSWVLGDWPVAVACSLAGITLYLLLVLVPMLSQRNQFQTARGQLLKARSEAGLQPLD